MPAVSAGMERSGADAKESGHSCTKVAKRLQGEAPGLGASGEGARCALAGEAHPRGLATGAPATVPLGHLLLLQGPSGTGPREALGVLPQRTGPFGF